MINQDLLNSLLSALEEIERELDQALMTALPLKDALHVYTESAARASALCARATTAADEAFQALPPPRRDDDTEELLSSTIGSGVQVVVGGDPRKASPRRRGRWRFTAMRPVNTTPPRAADGPKLTTTRLTPPIDTGDEGLIDEAPLLTDEYAAQALDDELIPSGHMDATEEFELGNDPDETAEMPQSGFVELDSNDGLMPFEEPSTKRGEPVELSFVEIAASEPSWLVEETATATSAPDDDDDDDDLPAYLRPAAQATSPAQADDDESDAFADEDEAFDDEVEAFRDEPQAPAAPVPAPVAKAPREDAPRGKTATTATMLERARANMLRAQAERAGAPIAPAVPAAVPPMAYEDDELFGDDGQDDMSAFDDDGLSEDMHEPRSEGPTIGPEGDDDALFGEVRTDAVALKDLDHNALDDFSGIMGGEEPPSDFNGDDELGGNATTPLSRQDLAKLREQAIAQEDREHAAKSADKPRRGRQAPAPAASVRTDAAAHLYDQGNSPRILDDAAPKFAAAAIQIGVDATGKTTSEVLTDEEEEIEIGAAEDYDADYEYDDDVVAGEGFSLRVDEYEDAEEEDDKEDEEEPESEPESEPEPANTGPSRDELKNMMERARQAADRGDLEAGVGLYSDVLDADPDHAEAMIGRGRLYLDLGDYARAMSDFTVAEDLAPSDPNPQVAVGDLYFARKEYRKAIDYFDAALRLSPDHAMAYCRRGISHYYRKAYNEALDDLNKAQKLDADIPNIRTYVAMAKKKCKKR